MLPEWRWCRERRPPSATASPAARGALGRAAAPQQAPAYQEAPPRPPRRRADPVEQLTKLGELRDSGVLTEEEFAAQKAKILG